MGFSYLHPFGMVVFVGSETFEDVTCSEGVAWRGLIASYQKPLGSVRVERKMVEFHHQNLLFYRKHIERPTMWGLQDSVQLVLK